MLPIDAPFVAEGLVVRPEWIDYNGHMNIAYYVKAFDEAFEQVSSSIGIGAELLERANASTFTAELHLTYQRELHEGDPLRVTMQLLGHDAKRMHFLECMYHAREGYLAATSEWMLLYIDMNQRKAAAMPEAMQRHLARVLDAHAKLPIPPEAGRAIALKNRRL
jgi:acyl-CoA thioester hydrolase